MTDVTIIVATYDRPRWLAEELESINVARARTSATVRVLVVDDASPSPADRIAEEYGCDYLRRETNGGVAATLAAGFEASDSTFTSFWGDDDIMLPNWFEANLARADDYDVVANSYTMVDADLEPLQTCVLPPVTFADLRADIVAANDGSLLRRSVVTEGSLRPERERAMMLTLWLALASKGARFTTITTPTWLYRRHAQNMSGQLPLRREPRFAQMRRDAIAEYA